MKGLSNLTQIILITFLTSAVALLLFVCISWSSSVFVIRCKFVKRFQNAVFRSIKPKSQTYFGLYQKEAHLLLPGLINHVSVTAIAKRPGEAFVEV